MLKIKEKEVQAIYSVVMTWPWNLHGFSLLGKGSSFFNVFKGKNLSSSCDLLDESSQHMFSAWVIETLKYI